MINVKRHENAQSVKDHTHVVAALKQCCMILSCMAVLFIFIGGMPFLTTTVDNADPLFALVITPGFYLHHIKVTDQDPASIIAVY